MQDFYSYVGNVGGFVVINVHFKTHFLARGEMWYIPKYMFKERSVPPWSTHELCDIRVPWWPRVPLSTPMSVFPRWSCHSCLSSPVTSFRPDSSTGSNNRRRIWITCRGGRFFLCKISINPFCVKGVMWRERRTFRDGNKTKKWRQHHNDGPSPAQPRSWNIHYQITHANKLSLG